MTNKTEGAQVTFSLEANSPETKDFVLQKQIEDETVLLCYKNYSAFDMQLIKIIVSLLEI